MRTRNNPVRSARRKAELCERNGSEEIRCIYCGHTDPLVVRPRRIQDHHILGRERDPITAPVCLNCHAVAHERIRDANVSMKREKDPTELARAEDQLMAVHFSLLSDRFRERAKRLDKK